jgi:hypothetical protein
MEDNVRDLQIIVITGVLAVGFFLASYFATDIAPTALAEAKFSLISRILASICSSFVFLLVLNLANLFMGAREKRMSRVFSAI